MGDFTNPDGQRLSAIMRDHLDGWFAGLGPRDVTNLRNPQQAIGQLRRARLLWHVVRKHDILDEIFQKAERRASASYTMAGEQTALKQLFQALANNRKKFSVFAPDEQAAIDDIIRTGRSEYLMRLLGKMAIRSQLSMVGVALNTATFGGAGLVMAGIGETAKRASEAITTRKARDLSEMVRRAAGTGQAPPAGLGRANPAFWGGQATGAGGALVRWHGLLYQQTPDGRLQIVPGQSLRSYDLSQP
jgi:hypothetical protein